MDGFARASGFISGGRRANPNGVEPLVALIDCIYCDACYVTCDGATAEC